MLYGFATDESQAILFFIFVSNAMFSITDENVFAISQQSYW